MNKLMACISLILLSTRCLLAQPQDTIYTDSSKKLVIASLIENKILKFNPDKRPLVVIDGFIYENKFEDIDARIILSFDTIGLPGATNIYGEQGKNGALLITTFKTGLEYCQRKLSNFSFYYRLYLQANNNDDSGLVYILDGVVLDGKPPDIIKKLYAKIEMIKTINFISAFSKKFNLNNPKPLVVITTKQ